MATPPRASRPQLRPFGRFESRSGRVTVAHSTLPAHQAGGAAIVPFVGGLTVTVSLSRIASCCLVGRFASLPELADRIDHFIEERGRALISWACASASVL